MLQDSRKKIGCMLLDVCRWKENLESTRSSWSCIEGQSLIIVFSVSDSASYPLS